ncbi:MAG: hypothetical protein ABIA75_14910 [Candidatus Neomarinimicrobiota bacterium]
MNNAKLLSVLLTITAAVTAENAVIEREKHQLLENQVLRLYINLKEQPLFYSDFPESGFLFRSAAGCDSLLRQINRDPTDFKQVLNSGKKLQKDIERIVGNGQGLRIPVASKPQINIFYFSGAL